MTNKHGNGVSRGGNWIPWRILSAFGMNESSTFTPSFGIIVRSLKEDYPIWIGSMWILWRQQPQKSLRISADNNTHVPATHGRTEKGHAGPDATTLNLLIDAVVLGTLLIYKKSCEEKYRRRFERRGDSNDDEEKDKTKTKTKVDETKDDTRKKETDSINELRRLLKERNVDSSEILSPKLKRAMGLPSVSDLNQPVRQQSSLLGTIEAPSTMASDKNSNQKRYIELLVHNVSHTDLVLSLDAPLLPSSSSHSASFVNGQDGSDSWCLCRPRFSAFDAYSQRLVDFFQENQRRKSAKSVIRFPRYERNDETQQPEPSSERVEEEIPIGFRLRDEDENENENDKKRGEYNKQSDKTDRPLRVSSSELNDLRVRGRDAQRVLHYSSSSPDSSLKINAVFFPLLATLMPLWVTKISQKYRTFSSSTPSPFTKPKKVLILVSGVGQPRNWTHSVKGNSTQQCAELMKTFLQTIYPELIVVHIHSDTNIFRYDENIKFVQNELLPRIQEYRDAHAMGLPYPDEVANLPPSKIDSYDSYDKNRPFSTEWRKSFSITLSYADGSPARNHAIQAALRTFKPMYYHFWQLKTFWHESKIVNSDIEVHSFEEMETLPPIETDQLQGRPIVKQVVDEMKKFRDDFTRILSNATEGSNDIHAFWLRKTHKPVIAVLAVETPNGKVKLYRGTNMEVSMPTGSLCAERNVIGTALADNPSLKRQDLKMIAVLAVPNPKQPESSTKNLGRQRVQSLNSIASLITSTSEDESSIGKPPFIPSRKSSLGEEEEWTIQTPSSLTGQQIAISQSGQTNPEIFHQSNLSIDSLQPPSPARTIYLYNKPEHRTRKQKRAVVVHSNSDINPLRPCGACNEWLKKLAESNPYFTIATFTDSACNGVYCTPCEE